MKILSTLFMLLLIVTETNAKIITGSVKDRSTNQALSGVLVTNVSQKTNILTDLHGEYQIEAQAGEELKFSYMGYIDEIVKIGNSNTVNVLLDPAVPVSVSPIQEKVALAQSTFDYAAGNAQSRNLVIRGTFRPMETESYASIAENKFTNPLQEPLSTFAADVDAASYSNVKQFIKSGTMPPTDAVHVEEMIKYFNYNLAAPRKGDPVVIMTELAQ